MGGTLSSFPDNQDSTSRCPCCGYCPHCGRSNFSPYQWPNYWYYQSIPNTIGVITNTTPTPGIFAPVVTNGQTYGISNEIAGWQGKDQAKG